LERLFYYSKVTELAKTLNIKKMNTCNRNNNLSLEKQPMKGFFYINSA